MHMTRRTALSSLALGNLALTSSLGSLAAYAESDTPSRIKVGQIGTTHAHATKLSVYRASPEYEVVGIVEPDDRLWELAQKQSAFAGLRRMSREELLNAPGLKAVLVETPVKDLLTQAEVCVAAGMHVHIDKPAGESLPHLQEILQAASRQNLLVQMGYMYRYNPAVVLLREFLQNGWLGELFELHTVMSKVLGATDRQELSEYPGGSMFELGCHIIDLVIKILGIPDKVHAYPRHSSTSADGLLDNMLAVFEYPKATATVRSSVIEIDGGARRHLTVCGTGGTFHIQPLDQPTAKITLAKACGKYPAGTTEVTFPKYVRYVDDAHDMAQIIRGEKTSDYSIEHDLTVQRSLLQACGLPIEKAPS